MRMVLEKALPEQTHARYWRKPLDIDSQKIPRGKVHIIDVRCKECGFCIEFCPKDVLEKSDKYNRKGYSVVRVVKGREDMCVACKHCEDICPEFALWIEEVKG